MNNSAIWLLQKAIDHNKVSPDDTYYDLRDETKQKLCALYANTMRDLDDLICDADNVQLAAYLYADSEATDDSIKIAIGEYMITVMMKYLEKQTEAHFDASVVDNSEVDYQIDRAKDREMGRTA